MRINRKPYTIILLLSCSLALSSIGLLLFLGISGNSHFSLSTVKFALALELDTGSFFYDPFTAISGEELGGNDGQSSLSKCPSSRLLCFSSERFIWLSSSLWSLDKQSISSGLLLQASTALFVWALFSFSPFFASSTREVICVAFGDFLLGKTAWLSVEHKAANTLSFGFGVLSIRCFLFVQSPPWDPSSFLN